MKFTRLSPQQRIRRGKYFFCETCGIEFYLPPSKVKKDASRFCSQKCYDRKGDKSPSWGKKHPGVNAGENNPMWKGDNLWDKKRGGRQRARKKFKEVKPCVICGNPKGERHHRDGNELNNGSPNIQFLCHKCHLGIFHTRKNTVDRRDQ